MKHLKKFEELSDIWIDDDYSDPNYDASKYYASIDDDDDDDDDDDENKLKKEFTRKLEDGIHFNYINAKAVKRYLDNGADINIVTDDGSLLNKAISNREPEIVKVLLDYGIKVDDEALRTLDYFIKENEELGEPNEEDYIIKKMLEPYR
jgi:hypothetical protein